MYVGPPGVADATAEVPPPVGLAVSVPVPPRLPARRAIRDRVVVREPGPGARRSGSTVKGILTADICVLDDISRAPGEALNVLLRLLNERWTDGEGFP